VVQSEKPAIETVNCTINPVFSIIETFPKRGDLLGEFLCDPVSPV
jgi:hypothetical protein